jgi:hypothetical protein
MSLPEALITHILNQLENLLLIADLEVGTDPAKVLSFAGSLLHADDVAEWPRNNLRGEQTNYLEALLARAIRESGGAVLPNLRNQAPPGPGEDPGWQGDEPPTGIVPGVND